MREIRFLDKDGSFYMEDPQHTSGLYLPVAGPGGLKSCVTPDFGGDAKTDQNHFLLAPKSIEDLNNERDVRNFFCVFPEEIWSAVGASAAQEAARFTEKEDRVVLRAGRMWQEVTRKHPSRDVSATVTVFAPLQGKAEVMEVCVRNEGHREVSFTPVAAVPLYGRSADNLRDHRHVTSLLHRCEIRKEGVLVKPTLSFDERGHGINDTAYFVYGAGPGGENPEEICGDLDAFLGEGGTLLRPRSLFGGAGVENAWKKPGDRVDGREIIGALKFEKCVLSPGESVSYRILMGIEDEKTQELVELIRDPGRTKDALEEAVEYWKKKAPIHFHTGDRDFDLFMEWVSFQPELRRIYGCSFLPHHDYGRGGRGWRDLWQDCLALLLTDPKGVREMLLNHFKGVRMDGTNATIILEGPGAFKGDRNGISRVWMDHGFWPFLTMKLYMDQTGDLEILEEEMEYFRDRATRRGEAVQQDLPAEGASHRDREDRVYRGSVLEHLLIQNLIAVLDVGKHGICRLRNADWNDALDMAPDKGESVAFTCGYAGNLRDLGTYLRIFKTKTGLRSVKLCRELEVLLFGTLDGKDADAHKGSGDCGNTGEKDPKLSCFLDLLDQGISGEKKPFAIEEVATALEKKAEAIMRLIRQQEWVTDRQGNGWFNGYYDNLGRPVEGVFDGRVRMMLTGQVFSVMQGVARKEQIERIIRSADTYLYREGLGGYCLNTDFGELRTDLGRMFGFAYGEKENGAVFSHMAVMYAAALYKRGFASAGYKALKALFKASSDTEKSRIYPGIPEYFNLEGRGLYHYLTGAASWYLLTMLTESFGIRGNAGDLYIEPKLLPEQFDEEKEASVEFPFGEHTFRVVYKNPEKKEEGDYHIVRAVLDQTTQLAHQKNALVVPVEMLKGLKGGCHTLEVTLR